VSEQLEKSGRDRKIVVIGTTLFVVVLVLVGWGVWTLLDGHSKRPPKPPKITLLEPPPPPPPPPKFEKKPDPPKEQKEIKEPPKPKEAPPQPSPELKMEGPAGDGPSAFAAGKVTSDDVSKIGTGNGMFNPFNNYANLIKGELQRYFSKNSELRRRHYTVEVHVWVAGGGEIKRFELIGSTGDSDTDGAIQQSMSTLKGFKQTPPANMPQPIRLRIVTAG
jgi:protein TonB